MAVAIVPGRTDGVGTVTMYQWTVRRYGAHPRNQLTYEQMLGIVEAPDQDTAKRVILDAVGVTLYDGQWLEVRMVRPDKPSPARRIKRALYAQEQRESQGDAYDAWVLAGERSRWRSKRVKAPFVPVVATASAVDEVTVADQSPGWLEKTTAWLLRQRDTRRPIYVIGTSVWRVATDDGVAFVRWLCGPYRDGVQPHVTCVAPEVHASAGWCPLRDRSYDAVAIARRVNGDRVKLIVLDGDEHWFDNYARPASPAILRPRVDAIGYGTME